MGSSRYWLSLTILYSWQWKHALCYALSREQGNRHVWEDFDLLKCWEGSRIYDGLMYVVVGVGQYNICNGT
jgi:hypothetical protein